MANNPNITIIPLFYFLAVVSCIALTTANRTTNEFFLKVHIVYILNDMDDDSKPLIARCKSGDDDFGEKLLKKGESFYWRFKLHLFGRTLYFCRLRWEKEKNRSFDVFEDGRETRICNINGGEGDYYWKANREGIYFSCDGKKFHKRCEWDQKIKCTD
ncbi:hypothetical protein RND81_01G033000 [Saponaria officinalis]|uniref:S-protein homolog n=1 Tax=Saponaria officinalis TaxID=3572 RepID=A0AAW1NCD2_SAPOF